MTANNPLSSYMTTLEFAEAVGVSRQTIVKYRSLGKITPAFTVGDHTTATCLWNPADVPSAQALYRDRGDQ